MDPTVASDILALRPALESLVVRAAKEPEEVLQMNPVDEKVVSVIKELCKLHAGSFGIEKTNAHPTDRRPPRGHTLGRSGGGPPPKFRRGFNSNRGSGGGYGGGGYGNNDGYRGGARFGGGGGFGGRGRREGGFGRGGGGGNGGFAYNY